MKREALKGKKRVKRKGGRIEEERTMGRERNPNTEPPLERTGRTTASFWTQIFISQST